MGKWHNKKDNDFGDDVVIDEGMAKSMPGNVAENVGKGLKTAVLTVGKGLETLVSGGIGKRGDYPETNAGQKVTKTAQSIGNAIERAATGAARGLDKKFGSKIKDTQTTSDDDVATDDY